MKFQFVSSILSQLLNISTLAYLNSQEEKGNQQYTEISQSKSVTELFTKLSHESNVNIDNNLKKNVGMLVRITPRMINYWATVRFCEIMKKPQSFFKFLLSSVSNSSLNVISKTAMIIRK